MTTFLLIVAGVTVGLVSLTGLLIIAGMIGRHMGRKDAAIKRIMDNVYDFTTRQKL